ncbi:MAG: HAD family phosphatase, partial [Lachnospiraceae bacterium]|nr:HAD family phosphatase [Lachnospiraceae bacterium]
MGVWGEIDIEYMGRLGLAVPEGLQMDISGMSFYETAVYFKER